MAVLSEELRYARGKLWIKKKGTPMQMWYHIFSKNSGLNLYVWLIFCILPFYFIFNTTSIGKTVIGIVLILLFFVSNRISAVSKGWLVYFWVGLQIVISIAMAMLFGFVYFSLFLAYFIGNIENKIGFFILYSIHLLGTIVSVNWGFITENPQFFSQFPFIIISVIGVILLPFSSYNSNKRARLEEQLEDANKQIAELVKIQERQRIARDLHDTLGQKLSLIGLKSDLANKLLTLNPEQARHELEDIRYTARIALKEVREMVSEMRGNKLEEELVRVRQILKAAQIEFYLEDHGDPTEIPLLVENVASMCMKEAVTNVVKHSNGDTCRVIINRSSKELSICVADNGVGIANPKHWKGNGLRGMRERLEFVNGSLEINNQSGGTSLIIRVPVVFQQQTQGVLL